MDFTIHPLKGVNDIEFGMTREMVRARMTGTYEELDRFHNGEPEDMYMEIGATFDYGKGDHLLSCEIFRPARALLGDIDMLSLSIGQSEAILRKLDPSTVNVRYEGVTAFDLALSAWAYDSDDQGDEAPLDTFLSGISGYFDESRPGAPEKDIWELADGLGEVTQEFVREYFGERPLPKSDPKQE